MEIVKNSPGRSWPRAKILTPSENPESSSLTTPLSTWYAWREQEHDGTDPAHVTLGHTATWRMRVKCVARTLSGFLLEEILQCLTVGSHRFVILVEPPQSRRPAPSPGSRHPESLRWASRWTR